MENTAFSRYFSPPPRLAASAEALPHLGGLALARYTGELPDETELHPVETLRDAFTDARAHELLKQALGLPEVRARLARGRVEPIGIARRGEAAKKERVTHLVVAYDYTANVNPPRITGYTFANSVAVTVRDLDKVGDAIDGALAAGATSFDGVSFRVDDPAKAQQQARTDAMTQAKAHADTLAAAAGVAIRGVASISETTAQTPYPVYFGASGAAAPQKDVATPIQTGTADVTITVSVVYLIG